jgi:hypothetical protein
MSTPLSNGRWQGRLGFMLLVLCMGFVVSSTTPSHAQALGWEGETGLFVTPSAYTASSETQKFHPVVAYHYFNGGPVIGDFHEVSIELGIGKRFELGYTHEFHTFGSYMTTDGQPVGLSALWQNGFDIFNGKVNLVPENYGKTKWVPAISTGFIVRPNVRNVGNFLDQLFNNPLTVGGKADADFYVVASKVVPAKHVPIMLSAGVRETDAELWGMGGNAPNWQARAFGAVAFFFKGPGKSTIVLGSEAAQQPHHPYELAPGDPLGIVANIPTTLTYYARFVPTSRYKLTFDFGIAQVAGNVNPMLPSLQARHQVGLQMSYGF